MLLCNFTLQWDTGDFYFSVHLFLSLGVVTIAALLCKFAHHCAKDYTKIGPSVILARMMHSETTGM